MVAALADLSRRLHAFSEEVKKAPDREEVKQLERSIKQLADEFSRAQQNVRDHIRDQLIPQLHKELDQLREQLHKEGRDGEIEEIDKQVKAMSRA
jgi:RNA processing factor Prp31